MTLLDECSQPARMHATTCPRLALWSSIFWPHLNSLCRTLPAGAIACLSDIAAKLGKLLFQIFTSLSKMLLNLTAKPYQIADAHCWKFECCLTWHIVPPVYEFIVRRHILSWTRCQVSFRPSGALCRPSDSYKVSSKFMTRVVVVRKIVKPDVKVEVGLAQIRVRPAMIP